MNADRIQVEVSRFPGQDNLGAWKKLAAQGVGFVAYRAGFPNDDEIRRLNDAAFSRAVLIVDGYPAPEDGERLKSLHVPYSVTFMSRAYPRYEDKSGLASIDESIPLTFASDYWPHYTHMDVFNMLPHAKRLRVSGGGLPSDESIPYLRNIAKLTDITLDTEYDPDDSDWRKLDGLPLTRSSRGHVPTDAALRSFAQGSRGAHRKLVVDSDLPLTADERERLEGSELSVEWIHAAPFEAVR
jgi:hypothetical protein